MNNTKKSHLERHTKALFFDAGGTLLKPFPSVGDVYSFYAKKYGKDIDPKILNKVFYQVWNHRNGLAALQTGVSEKEEKSWWKELVRDVFRLVDPIERFDDFFDELYHAFASENTWKIFDEVFDVLTNLKAQGYYLAIISNWDHRLIEICANLKLDKCFDEIFVSALVGYAKPDSRIFEKACDKGGVLPREALHIGDSITDDYYGAKNAGLDALFLDREGTCNIPEVLTIQSLREVIQ